MTTRMKLIRALSIFFAAGSLLLSPNGFAKTYSIGPCESKGGEGRIAEALCDLAQDTVINLKHQVTQKNPEDGTIKIKALRLENSYTLTANITVGDKIIASAKLKAASADEFDTIVPRLVRAVIQQEDLKSDAEVGEVTNAEAEFRTKRLNAKRESLIGFGFAGVANVDATRPYYNLVLGGGVDWTSFRLAGTWDLAWHAGERSGVFMAFAAAGNFFLTNGQSAPFVGPKIGFAFVTRSYPPETDSFFIPSNGEDYNSAFLIGAVAGWEFFRNYETSFSLELGMDYAFKDVGPKGQPIFFSLRGIVHR
jgi:hypothetical protein